MYLIFRSLGLARSCSFFMAVQPQSTGLAHVARVNIARGHRGRSPVPIAAAKGLLPHLRRIRVAYLVEQDFVLFNYAVGVLQAHQV